jgi:diguanylate cyclase (GGDEF)-like protein
MSRQRTRIAALLSLLALEGILITDPVRPWLPFSLWTFDASTVSAAGIIAFAAFALMGAFLPFHFPGLKPLPVTFPLIGACLLLYGLPPAAALGTATILLVWCRHEPNEFALSASPRISSVSSLAGLGIGLLIADLAGYFLPPDPAPRGSLDLGSALTIAALLSGGIAIASIAARYFAADDRNALTLPQREWTWTLVAAPVAAGLSLAVAQAVRIWGLGPVSLRVAVPFAVMSPLVLAFSRERRNTARERQRTDGLVEILEAVALAIEAKDRTSASHLRRMRAMAAGLGRRLGMTARELEQLDLAALLHDIGKLAVPEWILSKPGRLTDEEHQKMTLHSETGAGILDAVPAARDVAPMVKHHHENYDGSGYPDGKAGMAIPLGARILAVVDALDSITSERAYRRALGREEALGYIRDKAGSLFDPRIVNILIQNYDALMAEADRARDRMSKPAVPSGPARPRAAGQPAPSPDGPMQEVLDTIASSHMETYSLHEIGQALGKAFNVEESLTLIAGRLSRLFHYTACSVFVLDRENGVLVPRLAAGRGADLIRTLMIPLGKGVSGWAAKEARSINSAVASHPTLRDAARSDLDLLGEQPELADLTACLVAPMFADQEVVGVIALYDTGSNPYSADEERLLCMVGRQVGPAIRNGILVERAQEHTLTDFLTGLPNTRYMFVAMDQELSRCRDAGQTLSILLIDLDAFGRVNEEFGHPVGDKYLIGVSKVIRSQMRDRDTCIRYSGDEFVAILPGVDREEALQVAERIRRSVAEFSVEGRAGRRARLTVSVGHATFSLDGEVFEEMIAAADERMSHEKVGKQSGEGAGGNLLPFRGPKPPSSN